jgi:hypothetical protein
MGQALPKQPRAARAALRRMYQRLRDPETAGLAAPFIEQAAREIDEEAERARFFQAYNAGYAELRADPDAWAEELRERALWDVTLADGLRDA